MESSCKSQELDPGQNSLTLNYSLNHVLYFNSSHLEILNISNCWKDWELFFLSHFSEPLNGFLKFKCDICNRKFEKRTRMIRHIKNMHSSDIHRVDLSKFVLPKKFQQRHTWSLIELWQIAEEVDLAPHPWGQSHAHMAYMAPIALSL